MSNAKEVIEEQGSNGPEVKSAIDQAAPTGAQLEAPEPQAFPLAALRWSVINTQGDKVLEQAHRVEQLGKTLGVMWKEVETIPFGNVVDPTK